MRSAKVVVVKFVQGVWFVRQPLREQGTARTAVETCFRARAEIGQRVRTRDLSFPRRLRLRFYRMALPGEIAVPLRQVYRHRPNVPVVMGDVTGFKLDRRAVPIESPLAGDRLRDPVRHADGRGRERLLLLRAGAVAVIRARGNSLDSSLRVRGGSGERSTWPSSRDPSGAGAGAGAWWRWRSSCVSRRKRHVSSSQATEPGGDENAKTTGMQAREPSV
jgi:hypothetical protein